MFDSILEGLLGKSYASLEDNKKLYANSALVLIIVVAFLFNRRYFGELLSFGILGLFFFEGFRNFVGNIILKLIEGKNSEISNVNTFEAEISKSSVTPGTTESEPQ
jgi:hypothetical protein